MQQRWLVTRLPKSLRKRHTKKREYGLAPGAVAYAVADCLRAYVCREDAIYQEGYKRGASEAVAKMDTEVERQARAAYAHAVVEDERKHTEALREQIDRLRKAQYR